MTNVPNIPPSRAVLRRLLIALASPPSEFHSLLVDHFFEISRYVPSDADLRERITVFLEQDVDAKLWDVLRRWYSEFLNRHHEIWAVAVTPVAAAPNPQHSAGKRGSSAL